MTNPLPFEKDVHFALEPMPAFRAAEEVCQENDVVQIFENATHQPMACAVGFRNFGFYIGLVMTFGAPIGFGKVLHIVNNTAFVYWTLYPVSPTEEIISQNGNEHGN